MGVESWNNPKFQPQSFPTPVGHNRRWNLTALDPYLSYKWSVCLWVQKLICPIFQASLHNSKGSRGANGGVNEKRRFTYCLRDLLGKQYKSSCSLSHKFPYFLQKSLLMKTWVYHTSYLAFNNFQCVYTIHSTKMHDSRFMIVHSLPGVEW